MTREEANYYLKSSGFSDEQIETVAKAYTEPKTGRWEEIRSIWGGQWEVIDNYKCSVCGELEVSGNDYKYCPHCGAKMESEEQE